MIFFYLLFTGLYKFMLLGIFFTKYYFFTWALFQLLDLLKYPDFYTTKNLWCQI